VNYCWSCVLSIETRVVMEIPHFTNDLSHID